ncbi:MAG: Fic family protein [Clostridia bacterium]
MSFKIKYKMDIEDNIFFAKRKLVDNIYKSARLEGISITFAQTEDILNNVNVSSLRPDEIVAVLNLRNAWQYIFDTLEENIDINYIKQVHTKIGSGLIYPLGEFRNCGVGISGTNWRPKLLSEVDYYLEFKDITKNKDLLDYILNVFLWIQRSQMFKDGNKRTANLIANHELIKNGLGIISIPVELLGIYKEMLVKYYETNDNIKIKQFIYDNCIDGIN